MDLKRIFQNELRFNYPAAIENLSRLVTVILSICWRLRDVCCEQLKRPPPSEIRNVLGERGLAHLPSVRLWQLFHVALVDLCGKTTGPQNFLAYNNEWALQQRCQPTKIFLGVFGWVRTWLRRASLQDEFAWVRSALETTSQWFGLAGMTPRSTRLQAGDAVRIIGLQSEKGALLNGESGRVLQVLVPATVEDEQRYEIRILDGNQAKSIAGKNLQRTAGGKHIMFNASCAEVNSQKSETWLLLEAISDRLPYIIARIATPKMHQHLRTPQEFYPLPMLPPPHHARG